VARKPGGKLEPRAASEVAHTRNIAGSSVWRILMKPHIFPLCMIRSITNIVLAVSAAQHRAISKEADTF
jgi:hypothetical protein